MSKIDRDWLKLSVQIQQNSGAKLPASDEVIQHALDEEKKKVEETLKFVSIPQSSGFTCN